MEQWFWAWYRLKNSSEREAVPGADSETVNRFIDIVLNCNTTHGDGKFARLSNFVNQMFDICELYRLNWSGDSELLTAFFMGVSVTFEAVSRIAEKINRG